MVRAIINREEYNYITDILNLDDKHIAYAYNLRWNIEEFFKTMKSRIGISNLISRSINGILIQAFSYLIAYIILNMIIDSIGIIISLPGLLRGIRSGIIYYYGNNRAIDIFCNNNWVRDIYWHSSRIKIEFCFQWNVLFYLYIGNW